MVLNQIEQQKNSLEFFQSILNGLVWKHIKNRLNQTMFTK